MHEMQGPDDCGPFAGYEGKLSPDVDAGFSVPDLRQYHGPIDPFSPFDPAGPASRAAHETFGEKDGSTGCGGIGSRRCRKTKQSTRRGVLSAHVGFLDETGKHDPIDAPSGVEIATGLATLVDS